MKIKYVIILFTIFLGATFLMPKADANTITLDGVENAITSGNVGSQPYLTIHYGTSSNGIWSKNDTYYHNDLNQDWYNYEALETYCNSLGAYSIESGGNVFDDDFDVASDKIYETLFLTAGTYTIRLSDNSSAYNLLEGSDNYWNAYVQIFGGINANFGYGAPTFEHEDDAISFYKNNYNGTPIEVLENSWVNFYINDWNSLDNTGSVTLDIQPAPVPEPATLLLFGSGIAVLVGGRRYRRKELNM